ncbi:MAG TPA: DUF5666 domain-containing protein [Bryobacteraceae bacterium]|nr:DUF5666 domain-containing protein [Bryobacteraceae bacterium]
MLGAPLRAQEPASTSKPTEHVLGTVASVDPSSHTVTVKEDKTGTEYQVLLENTRTLLKVPPGAKDLKSATRIAADDLQPGDRVDVRGAKPDTSNSASPNAIAARSVVLMSARDLDQAHQQQAAAWQHSTAGIVNSVDPTGQKLNITARTAEGPKPVTVSVSKSTDLTRYSAENPKTPAPSQLADIQPGDQVRIIGQRSDDGASIAAQKIYSGAFRTLAGTVTAIAPDGRQITIKDLQTKQPVQVNLTEDSVIRKLPPIMAMGLARRLNPDFKAASGNAASENAGHAGGAPPYGAKAGEAAGPSGQAAGPSSNQAAADHQTAGGNRGPGGNAAPGTSMRSGTGDLSRVLERAPVIATSDLKTGDAVVVSGVAQGTDKSHLLASSIIAGVEPIFQSAPPQQGRALGDWSLDMQVPAQQ